MRKRGKKLVAMALATSMALGTVGMQAYANEPVVATESNAIENADGTTTNQNITTTTTTDSETGNVTVKVEITENTSGTNTDGAVVDGTMSSVKETTTDSEGTVLEETYEEDGKKTVVTEEDVAAGDEGQPEVKVELKPGETVTSEPVKGEIVKVEDSLVVDGENYNSKEVISEIEKVVQAELSKEAEVTDKGAVDLTPTIAPEDYDGKHYDEGKLSGYNQPEGLIKNPIKDNYVEYGLPENYFGEKPTEEGYNYQYVGDGDGTHAASPVFLQVIYEKNEDGSTKYDAKGNPVIDLEASGIVFHKDEDGNTLYLKNEDGTNQLDEDGNPIPVIDWEKSKLAKSNSSEVGKETYSGMKGAGQMTLKKDGEYFYVYCIDSDTPTDAGAWYKVGNLEDSDYYADEESANKLRAIVENGYWGTKEGTGSLESIKDLMRATYDDDDTVTVTDASGKAYTYKVVDLINDLKEHEALACTQGAIWSFSNGSMAAQNGADGQIVIGVQSSDKKWNGKNLDSPIQIYYRDYNLMSDARMKALYECLISLDGKAATDVVINEKNAVENMGLVIGNKAVLDVEDTRNTDDNPDNDVYNTSVEFTLAFVPAADDSISVYVLDAAGNVMKDAKGNDIVRKLVAEGSDEEGAIAAVNGVYTLDGLVFEENKSVEFSLQLKGMQHLDQGVYIYQAHGGREASQTLVGLAEGDQDVNVTKSIELTFNVDEKKKVTATTKWHEEDEYTSDPEPNDPPTNPDPTNPGGNDPEPNEPSGNGGGSRDPQVAVETFEIDESEVPLSDMAVLGAFEIDDDMIPLGVLPATGDNSLWFMIVSLFSGLSLAGASFVDKMKKRRR